MLLFGTERPFPRNMLEIRSKTIRAPALAGGWMKRHPDLSVEVPRCSSSLDHQASMAVTSAASLDPLPSTSGTGATAVSKVSVRSPAAAS